MTDELKTERDLCAAFVEAVNRGLDRSSRNEDIWTVYPETCGWDIVLVRQDGFQIGVEAKLRLNAKVVAQALPGRYDIDMDCGPDCRAVLVPKASADFVDICGHLGITIITMRHRVGYGLYGPHERWEFLPRLPWSKAESLGFGEQWLERAPMKRLELPDYVPDCDAGVPSPLTLTQWKVKAIKIAVLLDRFGFLKRRDFKEIGIDERRWLNGTRWLRYGDAPGTYRRGEHFPDFRVQHPKNYDEIAADIERWLPRNRRDQIGGGEAA